MEKELFERLKESITEAIAHQSGELDLPPENISFIGEPDPRLLRAESGLSREAFAERLGISMQELEDWEQGRRRPDEAYINFDIEED